MHNTQQPVQTTALQTQNPAVELVQPEPAPRGIVGRALQKMDAIVQRLAQHFESRLAPDVLREVQHLGQAMAQSGVKEVPIPTGPEPQPAQTPARGPEQ